MSWTITRANKIICGKGKGISEILPVKPRNNDIKNHITKIISTEFEDDITIRQQFFTLIL
jgi:hypothetical protein